MSNQYDQILSDVARKAMESLAFLIEMPDDEPCQQPSVSAMIRFTGPFNGVMFIKASPEILQVAAVNMLGMMDDEEISSQFCQDAFKELLNVICGNFLPEYAGNELVFDVAPAEMLDCADLPAEFESLELIANAKLTLDAGKVELVFFAASKELANAG
ncbi:MAG TPA: chemotaxis protein CheX [Phycisphaerae bacterium]|nr:chemotaxis protein CheX [Phycisphaerae bacterium]